jgi:hypothetical protein
VDDPRAGHNADEWVDAIGRDCGKEGWDSYGAAGVTPEAVDVTKLLLRSLWIGPLVDGGMSINFGTEAISVEVGADGRVVAMFVNADEVATYIEAVRKRKAEADA